MIPACTALYRGKNLGLMLTIFIAIHPPYIAQL